MTCYADLITGAALAGTCKRGRPKDPTLRERTDDVGEQREQNLWLIAAKTAHEAATGGGDKQSAAKEKAAAWLATDQPDGGFDRHPLHWPLVFPEVFDETRPNGPGFDAVIGNPPFLGGPKLRPALGAAYREFLVKIVAGGARGTNIDLIAFFALRAHALLNLGGQVGLIATNTLAQGDSREVGLDQLVAAGVTIRQAVKSAKWPARSAMLEYCAVWTSRAALGEHAEQYLEGAIVKAITSSLDSVSRITGSPKRLAANTGISHEGSSIFGIGFTLEPDVAQHMIDADRRNMRVVFPYLGGQDLNSRPDSSASRSVVDFHDWPEEEAATYRLPYEHVRRLVMPERVTKSIEVRRHPWWQFWRRRPALYKAIATLDRSIVLTRHTKTVMPLMVSARQVMSDATIVFATEDTGMLALLSSAPHYWWVVSWASTLETRIRYTPSDVFETLALPGTTAEMRELGGRLDAFRRELMLARKAGLTTTYNMVNDPACNDSDIAELREIHCNIDESVIRAYGWNDLLTSGLEHGFHETRQGVRYTIGAVVRQEILDRLLELNQERYAEEVRAGLHKKSLRRRGGDVGVGALF